MPTHPLQASLITAAKQCDSFPDARPYSGGMASPANVAAAHYDRRRLTTEELANLLGVAAQTLRKRFSQTGSYFGVRPAKLPNGRLRWPADSVEQLIHPTLSGDR